MSEPERPQGEPGATRAGRPALAPGGLSEEREEREPERPQGERGAEREESERAERVPVRDAATVVLLRDAVDGPEVYLLRRVRGMAFAAGMTVFPGGAVDPRDADTAVGWTGPPPSAWTEPFDADEALARALLCAAVRETFEESGVLLAGPSDGEVCATDGPDWEADRVGLEARDFSLAELLHRRGLVLRADLMRPWAHWITPPGEGTSRRYDTRFFVAALPAGQSTRDVTSEADFVEWVRPADALAQFRRGERPMMPPTIVTLEDVAAYGSVADVLAAGRSVSRVQPELTQTDAGPVVTLPDGRVLRLGRP